MRKVTIPGEIESMEKIELHQHLDGSIPVDLSWELMQKHDLSPVGSREEMEQLLCLQNEEEGTLLSYLDKFHYPLWITQFFENIVRVTEVIIEQAAEQNVKMLELRYSPIIHTYAGLTLRQAIRAVLTGINHATAGKDIKAGLVVIAMRQHGPHIAKILARQAISEAIHLHSRSGVIGFDIAGAERGNTPALFKESYDIARQGALGLTAHAGEDEGPENVWQAIDELGVSRVGHACTAVQDAKLLKRLADDQILVECCYTSNYQTGAVEPGQPHPIIKFLEAGVPVAICTDNTTVSRTSQNRENTLLLDSIPLDALKEIHRDSARFSFLNGARERRRDLDSLSEEE